MGLKEIVIKNFALIEYIDLEFSPGLNVITGETGAGKTLILKAIDFALGARMDSKYIKSDKKGSVTLVIDLPIDLLSDLGIEADEEFIIKREIDSGGRTKMYINGEPVPKTKVRDRFFDIFEFHGQFSNTSLFTKVYTTNLYDNFLGREIMGLKNKIRQRLHQLKEIKDRYNKLLGYEYEDEILYIEEQIHEFESLGLVEKSEEKLKEEEKLLRNAKEVIRALTISYNLLYENDTSVVSLLALSKKELARISSFSEKIEGLIDRIDSIAIEIEEISKDISDFRESLEIDEKRLDSIEELLSQIYFLKRKYKVNDMKDIITYIDELKKKREFLYEKKEEIEELKRKIREIEKELVSLSEVLSQKREEAREEIEKRIEAEIKNLGIPYARFKISFTNNKRGEYIEIDNKRVYITENGKEEIEFFFSANPDRAPNSLSKTASGGELSRVMLGIKSVLSRRGNYEKILLFDEIDQGIGERLGNVVGEKLKKLSHFNQVIVVTHLSQIAKEADNHIFVDKAFLDGKTTITARVLDKEEREGELLRMLGGEKHISNLRRG